MRVALTCLAVLIATAFALHAMGRSPICACGHVALWHGNVKSAENSQHLTDWYTFTHVIHGFLFYAAIWLIGRARGTALSFGTGLVLATVLAAGWEIVENTAWIIERYRAETISLGYDGDSIVNSLADIVAIIAGYAAAATLPVAVVVMLALATEVALAILIRDNLLLNVLMLVAPIDAVRAWQAGS